MSDRDKVLVVFERARARSFLDNLLIPLIKKSVKEDRKQDCLCSIESRAIVTVAYGEAIEVRNSNRLIN